MTTATQTLAANLLTRIDSLHTRFEQTGDDCWLAAAERTDAAYLRLMSRTP